VAELVAQVGIEELKEYADEYDMEAVLWAEKL